MNARSKHVGFALVASTAVVSWLGLNGCSTEDADPPGSGGSGGATGGSASGGGAGVTSGGSAGAATGGTGGSSGGSGGTAGGPTTCVQQPAPVSPLMMDFTDPAATSFGDYTNLFSGAYYAYPLATQTPPPAFPLTSTIADGVWTIAGTVGTYSGFGFAMPCNADVSAFDGIQFDIGGTNGAPLPLIMGVRITSDIYDTTLSLDTCVPANPAMAGDSCSDPFAEVPLPATVETVQLPWSAFAGGLPNASVNPAEFVSFYVRFPWEYTWTSTNNYEISLTIDNVRFMGEGPGSGGAGGTGGTGGTAGDGGMAGAP